MILKKSNQLQLVLTLNQKEFHQKITIKNLYKNIEVYCLFILAISTIHSDQPKEIKSKLLIVKKINLFQNQNSKMIQVKKTRNKCTSMDSKKTNSYVPISNKTINNDLKAREKIANENKNNMIICCKVQIDKLNKVLCSILGNQVNLIKTNKV